MKNNIATYIFIVFFVLLFFVSFDLSAFEKSNDGNTNGIKNENNEWSLYAGNLFEDALKAVGEGIKQGINEGLRSVTEPKDNAGTDTNAGQNTQQETQERQRRGITDMSDDSKSGENSPISAYSESISSNWVNNPREAIVREAFYALSKTNMDGTSTNQINGIYFGDWNYIESDSNAYKFVKSKLRGWSSDWTSDGAPPYECGKKGQPTCEYCAAGSGNDFYTNVEGYGFAKKIGRGGQCKFFAHLILRRAIGEESIQGYDSMNLNSTDIKNVQAGDIIFLKNYLHTAIVVDVKRDKGLLKEITVVESNKKNPKDDLCNSLKWWSLNGEAIGKREMYDSTEWNSYKVWTGASYYKTIDFTVTGIDDGDTIKVKYEGKDWQVRLIGVDAPETVVNDKTRHDAEEWGIPIEKILQMGNEAKGFTERIVKKGDKVRLEFDNNSEERNGEKVDPYNRLLAYVYLNNGTFLNAELLRKGYALFTPRNWRDGVEFPEKKYQADFQRLEEEAKNNMEGFWKIWLAGYTDPVSEFIIAVPKNDWEKIGKDLLYPIVYFKDSKYYEISVGGATKENEVAIENKYILSMLQNIKQYTVVSKGEVAGRFIVDRVKFGGGMSGDFAYIPQGKLEIYGKKDIDFLLSSFNQSSGNKFVLLKNISNDVIKDLTKIAGDNLLNASDIEPSNINISTLKIAYVKSYDTNKDGAADFFVMGAEVDVFDSSAYGGERSKPEIFLIIKSLNSTQYKVLYSSKPEVMDASMVGLADIDGDGNIEIVLNAGYYEGWHFEIWRYVNGSLIKVYSGTEYGS